MNSTCIIAACAANARARKKEVPVAIPAEELYYKVMLRKYYRFDSMSLAIFTAQAYEKALTDLIAVPAPITAITIEDRSAAAQLSVSVSASKCPDGVDSYIKENLMLLTSSADWLELDSQVVADYIKWVDITYGIKIPVDTVLYTTEYYWEVK
jgi:hypothetical protein